MDDLELDDLDLPTQAPAPSRPTKFAPKNSKLKPKPKSEPDSKPAATPKPELGALVSKQIEATGNAEPPVKLTTPKAEPSILNEDESAMKMEVDAKAAEVPEPVQDNDVPMAEAVEEEEDVVVREIDVFFTPSVGADTQLYVLQYPLRPTWRPYDMDEKCKEVRVKPKSTEVEVDLSMDTDSKNYDGGAQYLIKKQTLLTRWTPVHTSGYAVGVLNDNKLYLNPVHAVVQLRPSMNHIKSKAKSNVAVDSEEPKGGSVGPSKNQVQSKPMESSTDGKTEDEESWVPLKYHGLDSDISAGYLKSMVAQESSPIQFTMSPYDYVNSLCPGNNNNNKPKGLSKRYLLSLPLEERIKKLLCEGAALHKFNALKHFAHDHSVEDLLGVLQQHAVLIHGLWTAKTALLYPDDASKCLARDYALTLFNKSLSVKLKDVQRPYGIFLKDFGVERSILEDMKFKELPDESFMKLYPDIVKKQQTIFDGIEMRINNHLNRTKARVHGGRSVPGVRNAPPVSSLASKPGSLTNLDKIVKKGASEVSTGKKTMSAETREALPKALQKLFQTHKVCSYALICQGLRDMAVSKSALPKADAKMAVDAAYAADAPPEEFQEVISQIAVNIHGRYVLKSSPEHPEHDPLRAVVIDLYRGRKPDEKLRKADVIEGARKKLNREITSNEYTKVMNDLCVSSGSAWSLKSGNGNSR